MMIERTNGDYRTAVIDEPREHNSIAGGEELAELSHGSSPTRRKAADPSDIGLVGRSQAFIDLMKQVERAATTDAPVLLIGESGTGKALVAATIHRRSARADKPFLFMNCASISADSIEWEQADGGTLYLSEIAQASLAFQEQLLHLLQTGEISREGLSETRKLNVRVIAGSNRGLEHEVTAGRFRSDLFYRLNAHSIALPSLRERREDISLLAQSFVDRVYAFSPAVKFSTEALSMLGHYTWPGNIRELENVVVRAVGICDGTIKVKDLPQRVRNYTQKQAGNGENGGNGGIREEWVPLSEIEGRYVAQVLEHTRGNKQAAARVLAVDRKTLDRMIKRHHIDSVRRSSR